MSGAASVPLAFAAIYLPNPPLKLLFGCLAAFCVIGACYRVWRDSVSRLQATIEARDSEIERAKAEIAAFSAESPHFTVKILALYVQARFNPEFSQVAEWIKKHEITSAEAKEIGSLIEAGVPVSLQSHKAQDLLIDLITRCDVFLHVQITSDHPEPIKVENYKLQVLQHAAEAHSAWWTGGLQHWHMSTVARVEADGRTLTKTHPIKELPKEFPMRGIPVEGWLHFFIYDIPYSDIPTRVYRLNIIGDNWNYFSEINGSENKFSTASSLQQINSEKTDAA